MARDDKKDLPHGVVPVAAMFVGGVAARNLAAQGETRPQKALELAARLRRSGASPDTIHAETSKLLAGSPYAGVHYGRDGLPRFEVSDEQARIRPAGLDRSGRGFVGDVVQHTDLYRAHPETQLLEVQKANFTGGGFDGRTLHIGSNHVSKAMLAGRTVVKQSARGVALHEMQHAVQDAEGFAPGASPDDFEARFPGAKNAAVRDQLYITTAGEVEAENTRARRNMTAAQRRATPPSRTETVAVSEQHMGFDEGHTGMARQFGGDLPKGYSVERHTNSMGQTDYKIMHGKKQVGNAYVRDLGNKVQVGRISINEAHQRKGISTALYSQIERDLGKPVSPDDTLSDKAYKFWKKHRPEAVAAHKPTKSGGAIHDPYGLAKMLYADSEYADPETGGVRAGEVRRVQRMVEKSPPAGRTTKAAKPRATKQATPKITAFAKLGSAVNKLGAVSMIAVPVAAAYVAYHGTKAQAAAEGRDGTRQAMADATVAAGGAAAIGYGMMKAIGGTLSVAAKLAPRIAPALGPVGLGIGVVAMGHGAYKGYQRHGLKGAALGLVGADSVLDAPAAPAPASAAQPQPVQGRLNADQKTQFATANAAYAAMKSTTENAPQKAGWTDEARIAAYVERIKRQGGTPSNIPYGGEPRKQMSGPGGRGGDSDKSRKAGNARTQ